jgi:peroxiredoxin
MPETDLTPLLPRQPVPALSLPLAGGGQFTLNAPPPARFTLLVFYRGLHCPICSRSLADLEARMPDLAALGTAAVAISSDDAERAEAAKTRWKLPNLPVAHSLPLDQARRWGLYVSTSRGTTSAGVVEPERFSEPGLFLVRADGTLYFASVQTMPFARPRFEDILPALAFVIEKDYPARGEVPIIG